MSFSELETKLDAERDAQSDGSSDGEQDYEDLARLGLTPRVAVAGTITAMGFTGSPYDEQNIRGADNYRDNGDYVFTLENPEVRLGALWEARGRDEAPEGLMKLVEDYDGFYDFDARVPANDFRAVDPDGDNVSELPIKVGDDFEEVGMEYGSNGTQFPGEQVATVAEGDDPVSIAEDKVEIFQGGQSGRIMAQALDISQGLSAYPTDDGQKNPGLVEFPPSWQTEGWEPDDGYPRMAAMYPQLHPELQGEEIILFLRYGNEYQGNRKYLGHVFLDDGETVADCTELTGAETDDLFEPRLDLREPTDVWLEFHEPDGGWGDGSGSSADSGGMNFDELDGGDDSGDDDSTLTYDGLSSDTQTFVKECADMATAEEVSDIEDAFESDFETVVDNAISNGDIPEVEDTDALQTLVNERVDE